MNEEIKWNNGMNELINLIELYQDWGKQYEIWKYPAIEQMSPLTLNSIYHSVFPITWSLFVLLTALMHKL